MGEFLRFGESNKLPWQQAEHLVSMKDHILLLTGTDHSRNDP
jgi:hypothetical protein